MNLIRAKKTKVTKESEHREITRGSLFNFITGSYPPDVGDGPPEEVVRVIYYNPTETLELEDAFTDGDDHWTLTHKGKTYHVTELRGGSTPGFFEYIKCVRAITPTKPEP